MYGISQFGVSNVVGWGIALATVWFPDQANLELNLLRMFLSSGSDVMVE